MIPPFAALDFETATTEPDSACALAVVVAKQGRIVFRERWLIRPPRRRFDFSHVHGLGWDDVAHSPAFGDVWGPASARLAGVRFLAAHNAAFDRRVLEGCCRRAGQGLPEIPWLCTVSLARRIWKQRTNTLPAVCGHLGIPLRHHDALSDAEACAGIVLRAIAAPDGLGMVEGLLRDRGPRAR